MIPYNILHCNIKMSRARKWDHLFAREAEFLYRRHEHDEALDTGRGMTHSSRDRQADGAAARRLPLRRRRLAAIGLTLLAVVVFLFVSLRLAAPYLISSSVVRSAIASSIAEWAGYEVSVQDVAELQFWPDAEVTLAGVTISRVEGGRQERLVEIPRFSAGFSIVSALRGKPDFSDFRFEHPQIQITRQPDGRLNWSDEGLLSDAVRAAVAGTSPSGQTSDILAADIGSVEVIDGKVTVIDAASGVETVASDLHATVDWPKLSSPLAGEARFQLNGQAATITLETPTPLLLIGGSESEVELSTLLPGFSATLDGTVALTDGVRAGAISVEVDNMASAAAALGVRLAGTERWRRASLAAKLSEGDHEWRLEDLEFEVNDIRGDGILTLTHRDNARPLLSGTIALDHLELGELLQAFSVDVGDRANVRLPSVGHWVDLDLRLSATTAAFEAFPLTDLGASLVGRGDRLELVIGDTRFLGGTLSARLAGSGEGLNRGAEIAVMMDRVELAPLMQGLAIDGPSLKGTGSITLDARFVGTGLKQNIEAMSGRLEIAADKGEVVGFDAEGLRRLAADRAYFQLSAAGEQSFDYKTLDIAVHFSHGSAEVEKARIAGDSETLVLSGIIPYSRRALALTGELTANVAEVAAAPITFFIGGVWSDPVISPVHARPLSGQ